MNMKLYTVLLVFLLAPVLAFGSPAKPGPVVLIQPDGKTVQVYLRGDETVHWMESPEGYSLLYGENGFIVYAVDDGNGGMIPSDIVYSDLALRSATGNGIPKGLRFSAGQINMKPSERRERSPEYRSAKAPSSNGKTRALCVLMRFNDNSFTRTVQDFDDLMNQHGYSLNGSNGSVYDFYLEDSYGHVDMEITVIGPFSAKYEMEYYGKDIGSSVPSDAHPRELAEEAANAAYDQLGDGLADFDNDGDGYVDAFHVIYAGYGQEGHAPSNTIWAHEAWFFRDLVLGKVRIEKYSCTPELHGNSGTGISHIGVICHEMGHIFGAPDFYDIDNDENGQFYGTGNWDLMSGGSWNGDGDGDGYGDGLCPAHTNMYQKIRNGWVTPEELTVTTTVTGMENSAECPVAYKVNTPIAGEYFILENRQRKGFDAALPGGQQGHGLLIYHVSLTELDIYSNTVNNSHPQKMYPVCASASSNPSSLPSSYGLINSERCPFPGSTGKTSFTDETIPSFTTWKGQNADGIITDITETNGLISFNFKYTNTGIDSLQVNDVLVFPNPVKQGKSVTINSGNEFSSLAVFSVSGRLISEESLNSGPSSMKINFPKGVYLLKFSGDKTVVRKLIVR
ncbi:MAG: M6 family metalloprotease domain-containing protein [Dysgonamonadaceae bacterium]|jgi:M6 family metalloprotease-like protein|nr:M6 family metalloprotease domain-containing protein [Dysgonamonadaceae bacterium]